MKKSKIKQMVKEELIKEQTTAKDAYYKISDAIQFLKDVDYRDKDYINMYKKFDKLLAELGKLFDKKFANKWD